MTAERIPRRGPDPEPTGTFVLLAPDGSVWRFPSASFGIAAEDIRVGRTYDLIPEIPGAATDRECDRVIRTVFELLAFPRPDSPYHYGFMVDTALPPEVVEAREVLRGFDPFPE